MLLPVQAGTEAILRSTLSVKGLGSRQPRLSSLAVEGILVSCQDGAVVVWDLGVAVPRRLGTVRGDKQILWAFRLGSSDDLAVATEDALYRISLPPGWRLGEEFNVGIGQAKQAWRPDRRNKNLLDVVPVPGTRLIAVRTHKNLYAIDGGTWSRESVFPDAEDDQPIEGMAFSREGSAVISLGFTVKLNRRFPGGTWEDLATKRARFLDVAITEDGAAVAVTNDNGHLYLVDTKSRQELGTVPLPVKGKLQFMTFSGPELRLEKDDKLHRLDSRQRPLVFRAAADFSDPRVWVDPKGTVSLLAVGEGPSSLVAGETSKPLPAKPALPPPTPALTLVGESQASFARPPEAAAPIPPVPKQVPPTPALPAPTPALTPLAPPAQVPAKPAPTAPKPTPALPVYLPITQARLAANASTVPHGGKVRLTASYRGAGEVLLLPLGKPVADGESLESPALVQDTTFQLVEVEPEGRARRPIGAPQLVKVAPRILELKTASASADYGRPATVTARFDAAAGAHATLEVGSQTFPVRSGVPLQTPPLTATTTLRLQVANPNGEVQSQELRIPVASPAPTVAWVASAPPTNTLTHDRSRMVTFTVEFGPLGGPPIEKAALQIFAREPIVLAVDAQNHPAPFETGKPYTFRLPLSADLAGTLELKVLAWNEKGLQSSPGRSPVFSLAPPLPPTPVQPPKPTAPEPQLQAPPPAPPPTAAEPSPVPRRLVVSEVAGTLLKSTGQYLITIQGIRKNEYLAGPMRIRIKMEFDQRAPELEFVDENGNPVDVAAGAALKPEPGSGEFNHVSGPKEYLWTPGSARGLRIKVKNAKAECRVRLAER